MFEKMKDWYFNSWFYNSFYTIFYKNRVFSNLLTEVRTKPWEYFSFFMFKSLLRSGFSIKYLQPKKKEEDERPTRAALRTTTTSRKANRTLTGASQASLAASEDQGASVESTPLTRENTGKSLLVRTFTVSRQASGSKRIDPTNTAKSKTFSLSWERLQMVHCWPYAMMLVLRTSLFSAIDYCATLSWKNMASMRKRKSLNSTNSTYSGPILWAHRESEAWRKWLALILKVILIIALIIPETATILLKVIGDACILVTKALLTAWEELITNKQNKPLSFLGGAGLGLFILSVVGSICWLPVAAYFGGIALGKACYYVLLVFTWPITKLIALAINAWNKAPSSDSDYERVSDDAPQAEATISKASKNLLSATDVFNWSLKQLGLLPFKLVKWAGVIGGFLTMAAILAVPAFFLTAWQVIRHPIITYHKIMEFIFPPQKVSEILATQIKSPLLEVDCKTHTISTENPILEHTRMSTTPPIEKVVAAIELSMQQVSFVASQTTMQDEPSSWARMRETWELLFLQAQTLTCNLSSYSKEELPRENTKQLKKAIEQLKSLEDQYRQYQVTQKAKEETLLADPKQLKKVLREICVAFNASHNALGELEFQLHQILEAPIDGKRDMLKSLTQKVQAQLLTLDEHQSELHYLANLIANKIVELSTANPADKQLETLSSYQMILQLKIVESQEDEARLAKMQKQIPVAQQRLGDEVSEKLLSTAGFYGSGFTVVDAVPKIITPILERFASRENSTQLSRAAA